MPSILSDAAIEESTYGVVFTLDSVPNADLTWTLTDLDGTVINSREDVSVSAVAVGDGTYTVTVVLHGDDLALSDVTNYLRVVLLEGTYDSDLGNSLPIKEQATFIIQDLVAVS